MKHLPIAAAAALAVAMPAFADYPDQPVTFVVPWPPGDLEDVLTRLIADEFQDAHGVAAAVENRPGGGGGPFPGAVSVATAPPDGTTIGSFVIDVPTVGHTLGIPELDPPQFEPVGIFLTYPFVIATSADAPYQTMEELAEHAADNDIALGHFGAVIPPTRVTMALAQELGFAWGSDAAFDALDCNTLASGDADVINTTLQLVLPCLDDITVLAAVTDARIPIVEDAPTVGEIVPDLELALWNGLFVHRDTPQEVRDVIAATAERTVLGERAQEIAAETGAGVYWQGAEEAAARIEADMATLERIEGMLD